MNFVDVQICSLCLASEDMSPTFSVPPRMTKGTANLIVGNQIAADVHAHQTSILAAQCWYSSLKQQYMIQSVKS